jgi:hypothetical protein
MTNTLRRYPWTSEKKHIHGKIIRGDRCHIENTHRPGCKMCGRDAKTKRLVSKRNRRNWKLSDSYLDKRTVAW